MNSTHILGLAARGGFLNNLSASVKPRFAKWRNTPMPVREAIPTKRDERRFNNKFHFPSYERLLYASELCKTISGTQQILGKVFVSENFFCFRESRLQPKGGRRQRLNLVIPLDDILSISQAEISSQPDPKYAPDFRVLDQWHAKADGIFLYARDFKVTCTLYRYIVFSLCTSCAIYSLWTAIDVHTNLQSYSGSPLLWLLDPADVPRYVQCPRPPVALAPLHFNGSAPCRRAIA